MESAEMTTFDDREQGRAAVIALDGKEAQIVEG